MQNFPNLHSVRPHEVEHLLLREHPLLFPEPRNQAGPLQFVRFHAVLRVSRDGRYLRRRRFGRHLRLDGSFELRVPDRAGFALKRGARTCQ